MKFNKGSTEGMPILAVVGVIATLAGLSVIFGMIGSVSSQTGSNHDQKQLNNLASSINNKCLDIAGDSGTSSSTAMTVDIELRRANQFNATGNQLRISFPESGDYTESLSDEKCSYNFVGFPVDGGQYTVTVSQVEDTTEIKVKIE